MRRSAFTAGPILVALVLVLAVLAVLAVLVPAAHAGEAARSHLCAGAADCASDAAADRDFLVGLGLRHARLGRFVDRGLGDVERIEEVFGPPARTVREAEWGCVKRWPRLGLGARFVLYGSSSGDPCQTGMFHQAILTTRRWRTPNGIGPGVSARRAARLAPRRCTRPTCGVAGYGFALHRSECAPGRFPAVIAETSRGRVVRLIVRKRWCE